MTKKTEKSGKTVHPHSKEARDKKEQPIRKTEAKRETKYKFRVVVTKRIFISKGTFSDTIYAGTIICVTEIIGNDYYGYIPYAKEDVFCTVSRANCIDATLEGIDKYKASLIDKSHHLNLRLTR